jgi:DNA repair photolyase
MPLDLSLVSIKNVLTRTTGYLRDVTSHSLQPYRGCTFGQALCGVGCYVRHSRHLTQGREWGGFLEVRENAAESYREFASRERRWAHRREMPFSIFCSSATDPFVPQEFRHGVTRRLLEAMCDEPPDALVLQTHTHRVAAYTALLREVASRCRLRVHLSIETDREAIPGLPPHGSPVERRMEACAALREAGLATVVTVAPLLPIADAGRFFERLALVADAVVIDHFLEGDGSPGGTRTRRTPLPAAMQALDPESITLAYRDRIVSEARLRMPGRVGVGMSGFAGKYA